MYLRMLVDHSELDLKLQNTGAKDEVAMAITVVTIAIGILYIPKNRHLKSD